MGRIRGTVTLANPTRVELAPEAMDLVLRPQLQSIEMNPESPNIPLSVAT